jgi:hypothetical protein
VTAQVRQRLSVAFALDYSGRTWAQFGARRCERDGCLPCVHAKRCFCVPRIADMRSTQPPPPMRAPSHTHARARTRAMLAKGRQAGLGRFARSSLPRPPVLICQLEAARASTVHLNKDLEEVKSSGAAALSETLEDERRYRGLARCRICTGTGLARCHICTSRRAAQVRLSSSGSGGFGHAGSGSARRSSARRCCTTKSLSCRT